MSTYDKHKIGKLISWRGDHEVYEYGADKVIKFSKFDFFLGFKRAKEVVPQEYALCKQIFGEYLLDTEIAVSADQKRIALIQPKISGHCLTAGDLQREGIKRQFREIVERYNAMITGGYPEIDLVGHEGLFSVFKRCLGNIMVTNKGKLIIFDATLLNPNRFAPFMRPFLYVLVKIFRPFQRSTIEGFLAVARQN